MPSFITIGPSIWAPERGQTDRQTDKPGGLQRDRLMT